MAKLNFDELAERRAHSVRRNNYCNVILSITDETSRAGVVIGTSRHSTNPKIKAFYFRPAQLNRGFAEETIQSAHNAVGAINTLREKIKAEKAEKVAGHDFVPGDILASIWGATMRDVNFFQVVSVPTPRKVELVSLQSQLVEGNYMSGQKIPLSPVDGSIMPGQTFVDNTVVRKGVSYLKATDSITTCKKWDGSPIHIYSD